MHLMGIKVTIHFHYITSLKEKRRIIKSVTDRVRHKFRIGTAEVDYLDSLDLGSLGFGVVSNNRQHAETILQKVLNQLDILSEIEVTEVEWMEY